MPRLTFDSLRTAGLFLLLLLGGCGVQNSSAQRIAKYGADFLASGVGGRALGMGGAYVGLAEDVTAGYWNPAGLRALDSTEVAYMHAERFAGYVSFDYAGGGLPISGRSAVGLSIVRSGVNEIKNTLHAWDPERDQPLPNPDDHITTFSAADYAVLVSYARAVTERISVGGTGKFVRRSIGDFASAWGYSADVGIRYHRDGYVLAAVVQDITTMLQSWSVNRERLEPLQAIYNLPLPEGGTEVVLPVLRLGSGYAVPVRALDLVFGADVDVAFDGYQTYAISLGDLSFHPRIGAEVSYLDRLAVRIGANQLVYEEGVGYRITPTVGAGLSLRRLVVDYSFGDFAGMAADLGYSHRISVRVKLGKLVSSAN